MPDYVRSKKVKDIESASETLLFPIHPSKYSRGNSTSVPDEVSAINSESVTDIRLN